MITRNAMCPYGCGEHIMRTEDRGKVYYSNKDGTKHLCQARFEERNTNRGYVDDGCGCVERIW